MIKLPIRPALHLSSTLSLPRAFGAKPNFARFLTTASKRPTHHLKALGLVGAAAVGTAGWMALGSPDEKLSTGANVGTDHASLIEHADPSIAFEGKSISDLFLSLFVYKLCSLSYLTDVSPAILSMLEALHLSAPAYWVIKRTIFRHFCGGEDREDMVPFIRELQKAGIGSILDFSIEADLPAGEDTRSAEEIRAAANAHADFVCEQYRQAVTTASALPGSFIAVKVTGLVSPQLLEKATSILHFMRAQFLQADDDSDGLLTTQQFRQIAERLPGSIPNKVDDAVRRADPKRSGKVDWISFLASLSMVKPESASLYLGEDRHYRAESADCRWDVGFFSQPEREDLDKLMARLSLISTDAVKKSVRLMIDAEQSYFQACIDLVANELSQNFNKGGRPPVVYNTYQMYLKESYEKMRNDLIHAKRSGWTFGGKLVRGAYMVSERKRAAELGVPDIIQDTIEDTHAAFNGAVDLLLGELAASPKGSSNLSFMVASHNKASVVRTCRQMERLGLQPDAGNVLFGQLMGMHDTTTYALARHGFNVFKYIPYGPVREVMPYLIRRAQENSSVMAGASQEQAALVSELRRRILPLSNKNLPASN